MKIEQILIFAVFSLFSGCSKPPTEPEVDVQPPPASAEGFVPAAVANIVASSEFKLDYITTNGIRCYVRPVSNLEYDSIQAGDRDREFLSGKKGEAVFLVPILDDRIVKLSPNEYDSFMRSSWKTVDAGFLITMPRNWVLEDDGVAEDTHSASYRGPGFKLIFDEDTLSDGLPAPSARQDVKLLKNQEKNPELLETGEAIWRIDGRLALVIENDVKQRQNAPRNFPYRHIARMNIPYENSNRTLAVLIFYMSETNLPTVRRVFNSIQWKPLISKK